MRNQHIRILSDNTTAVTAVNKQGSVRNAKINNIARKFCFFAIKRDLWLSAAHCPGSENVEADKASRVFHDETKWTLEKSVFRSICQRFGMPDIDLFAARITTRARFHERSSLCDPGSLLTQDRSTRRVKIVSTNVGSVWVKRSLGSILSHSRCLRNVCLSKVL